MKKKRKFGRKLLSFLLTLALVLGLMPGMGLTAYAGSEVSYQEGSWSNNSVAYATKTAANPTTLASDTTAWGDGNWYVVPANGVTISDRISVTGTVNLILTDGNTFTASKGITVAEGNTLNIYAQSEGDNAGELLINGANYTAGIGGDGKYPYTYKNAGTVTIHGGKITTKGGANGAGIGGGYSGDGGNITIYGGTINAVGGQYAAGIGGGQPGDTGGNGGTVTIYGGTVTAKGSTDGGAGIGGGISGGNGGNVTINGGTVIATGGPINDYGCGSMGIGGVCGAEYDWEKMMDDPESAVTPTPPQNGSLTVNNGLKVYGGNSADPTTEITSEQFNEIYAENYNKTDVYRYMIVSAPPHTHSFTYAASGATITATCSADGCPLTENKATLTIAAPLHTAVGDDKSADAQITDANQLKGSATVSYYATDASSNKTGNALTSAPTDAGTYWTEITLGADSNTATAHVVYSITNPDYNVTLPTDLVGGTVTADKTSAKYGEAVTLTIEPDNGFTIKTVKYNDTAITANEGVYSFTMPAADVTMSAEFEGAPFDVTISNAITGGTVAVSSGLENGQAKAGSEVTLTVTPAAGYQLETLKYNNTAITASNGVYKFTMPTEAVTVTATFVGKDTSLTLSTEGNSGTTCTAKLLDSSYNETSSLTQKTGEEFILSIDKDEAHSYKVSFSPNATASMKEFSVEDYKAYINSTKSESLNTSLYWVTMPGVNADSVNMTVTFAEAKTFTILYQPTTSTDEVWVKFGYTENNEDKLVTAKMSPDAKMGNVAVWSLKMSAAFNPDKIAFATSESTAESADAQSATVSTTDSWNSIAGGQYLIIGNNAKTVIAAFTDDSSSANDDRDATVIRIGDDAEYQIAICGTDVNGTVATPDAPTKAGYDFVSWRGYEGITAKDYAANTQISVKENMVFSAVWQPSTPNVKLNLNGGTGIANAEFTVPYNDNTTLASLTPVKSGYSFAGWSVAKGVTEDGKLYTRGAPFDTGTKITADLELTAQWKHVHAYGYVQIGAVSSLATKYAKYAPYLHIKICGCGDVDLEAHSLDSSGRCVCGYSKSVAPSTAELNVSYGQWLNGNYTEKMAEVPENFAANSEVSVSAPGKWGSLTFSKWQYSTDNGSTWEDVGAYKMMSFVIPCDMKMRALYVNATTVPEVSMSATTYATKPANMDQEYNSILFRMNYKLPDGYTYVDSGVRSGDNAGISYYELKERTATMDGEAKAITYSLAAVMTVLQGELTTFDTSETQQYYAKRENSVLDEDGMDAAKLGEYMYQSKPINIQDPPLYWNYKPNTKGQSGSINALTPVGFAQRNNGDHYIYAIAWLQYKKPDGKVETIWTDAMATTLNGVPSSGSVSKTGE